ncbi:MAG: protein kinase [Deltaproteobacteria bacterium]|nr:protein kinase [Deltaproteobacteria bacterium]
MPERQYAVIGPLPSAADTRAFLGCEIVDGQPRRDNPVVVVWLPDEATQDPKLVSRFQREIAFVTPLAHPNIVRVHGLEAFQEGWARILDYCDGESLDRFLELAKEQSISFPARVAARIIADACDAIAYAHDIGLGSIAARPIVHGAIRPDTILVGFDGRTRVTNFGAVAVVAATTDLPAARMVYLSPEQIIGGRTTVSPATDIYGLGAVLYTLLAGKPPFAGADDVESSILSGEPESIESLAGDLAKVAKTAMAKRGHARFASAAAMRSAIDLAVGAAGLATDAEVAAFVEAILPADSKERSERAELLDSASDADSLTPLSHPDKTPAGIDPALFAASRPASQPPRPASIPPRSSDLRLDEADARAALASPVRAAMPRDEVTVVDAAPPRTSMEREITETAADDYPPLGTALHESTDRIQRRARESAPVPRRTSVSAPHRASAPASAWNEAAAGASGGYLPQLARPPRTSASPDSARTSVPAPAAHAGLPAPTVPQGVPVVQSMPVPQVMPQGSMPPGMMPGMMGTHPGMMMPQMPQGSVPPGMMPGMMGTHPGMMMPQMPQGSVPPGMMPGMMGTHPGVMGTHPGMMAPQLQQGSMPPGQFLPVNTGRISVPGAAQSGPRVSLPAGALAQGAMGSLPPGARTSLPPGAVARGSLPPMNARNSIGGPSRSSMPPQPISPVPQSPMREASAVTSFKKDVGDSSRSLLFIALAVLVLVIVGIFAIGKEPPPELSEETAQSRQRLPRELVEAALKGEVNVPELPSEPEPEPEAPAAPGPTGATGAAASPTLDAPALEEPKFGSLDLTTEPPVDVFDGSTLLGRTPLKVKLGVGAHKLRLTDGKKLINLYKTYRIRPGGEHKDQVQIGTGQLKLIAPDDSIVTLNGKSFGKAPMEPITLYEGRYLLKVVYEGLSWSETISAQSGQTLEYRVRFEEKN